MKMSIGFLSTKKYRSHSLFFFFISLYIVLLKLVQVFSLYLPATPPSLFYMDVIHFFWNVSFSLHTLLVLYLVVVMEIRGYI